MDNNKLSKIYLSKISSPSMELNSNPRGSNLTLNALSCINSIISTIIPFHYVNRNTSRGIIHLTACAKAHRRVQRSWIDNSVRLIASLRLPPTHPLHIPSCRTISGHERHDLGARMPIRYPPTPRCATLATP